MWTFESAMAMLIFLGSITGVVVYCLRGLPSSAWTGDKMENKTQRGKGN